MNNLDELIAASVQRVKEMSSEERQAMYEAQCKSWVRGMTASCEHGVLDFEQCPKCRALSIGEKTSDHRS